MLSWYFIWKWLWKLRSTEVKTNVANWLNKFSPKEKIQLKKLSNWETLDTQSYNNIIKKVQEIKTKPFDPRDYEVMLWDKRLNENPNAYTIGKYDMWPKIGSEIPDELKSLIEEAKKDKSTEKQGLNKSTNKQQKRNKRKNL
jgi:hypothetical protein